MYKNKEKQREAGAEGQRRYRENRKALHPAIVAGIERLTIDSDGKVNEQERKCRVANALAYQQLYPEQPYTGIGIAPVDIGVTLKTVGVTKPGDAGYKPLCEFTKAWCDVNN